MKKIIVLALMLVMSAFAQTSQNNEQCGGNGIPQGSCATVGFICNVGFNVAGEKGIVFFRMATDMQCTNSIKSAQFPTYYDTTNHSTVTSRTTFFVIEDENGATPVSVTLAGSIALSASLNARKVFVIYKQVREEDFGGVVVQSIEFHDE